MARCLALGLALTASMAGCGGAGGPGRDAALLARTISPEAELPLAVPAAGLHPGETMTFVVSLGGLEAGEAALAVGEVGQLAGREAIVVSSRVASSGALRWLRHVEDELTSTIDVGRGLPVHVAARVVFGARQYHGEGLFAGPRVQLVWHRGDGQLRRIDHDFGTVDAHDAHSAMAAMRAWHGEPGDRHRLYIVGGRRIWRTDVTWTGHGVIATRLGNQGAIRLDGTSRRVNGRLAPEAGHKPRTFTVWISDDADRVPLRVVGHTELGDVVIELVSYERP
jgi:hypothetical protein